LVAVAAIAFVLVLGGPAPASHTPAPTSVTIAGSLQSELGCGGDWDPGCAATRLTFDANDGVWQGTWSVPAGSWEYKAALNDDWAENYGANATRDGANISLVQGSSGFVKFYYDHSTHWITSNRNATIAVAPGSFQSELGCPGDWQADCLRSWLEDPDGDGTYTFTTAAIPAGSYEAKVAINESWDENYGAGGVQNGPNIPLTVTAGATVTFSYVASTHVLTITVVSPGPSHDGNVEWDGLRHDSRDLLYRTPGGAVPAGTPVLVRFRTFHDDVTGVKLRLFDVNAGAQRFQTMTLAATDVDCYDGSDHRCDFWQTTVESNAANVVWYRFLASDGADTDYYADDTPALDGGLGATSDDAVDRSYAISFIKPGFAAIPWVKDAVIYQVFPDRFKNGDSKNDPKTGDPRYDDPALALPWGTLPEGYCRNYADANGTTCPWRFDPTPPDWSPEKEGPRGRDYMGGDLKGLRLKLDYLQSLGVTAIYLNPIFDARSNHRYDTADYTRIDPYLGDTAEFDKLVKQAGERGIRLILDGVFNHMSSDSPFFDRYQRYATVGGCESTASPWRAWFHFTTANVPCGTGDYDGWFGFDSIPVLTKTLPAVQSYFLTASDSIARRWVQRGIGGWRMDVATDPSFPNGYWETFRGVVKGENPNAVTISEGWQKDSTLLRQLVGDRFDASMGYRNRDAIVGLLAPQAFDSKGFADSGRPLEPSEFAARLSSVREDYADAAYYESMNLLDSHDTERLAWTLTPGEETRAGREQNATNVAEGKRRLRLASLVQFTIPGAPTVYYGDEIGVTGDDDPDDRRTMPWPETGGARDLSLLSHYTTLAGLRHATPALVGGDFRILAVDDAAGVVAFGRKLGDQAAIVALNVGGSAASAPLPLAGFVPAPTSFSAAYSIGGASLAGGTLQLPALSGILLVGSGDLTPPGAPTGIAAAEGSGHVALSWNAVAGAAGYRVYRSPLSGGGYVLVGETAGTSFDDTGLENGRTSYYVVRALDAAGNESADSNEVVALPHLTIGWANLQWPPTLTHTISVVNRTDNVYGQVWIDGVTSQPGPTPGLRAQLGFGPDGSNPDGNAAWSWVDASFNVDAGNNDEFVASLLPEAVGTYDYAYRYSTTGGRDWIYADLDGIGNGYSSAQAGALTVTSSGDTTAPETPTGVRVVSASPSGIELAWDAVAGDPTLYGYEVLRGPAGGPYTPLARVTAAGYTDTDVEQGATYHYVVRALDTSFNRSGNSAEVTATAELRTVSVTFAVTVPATTDATGRTVHIAGTLSRLDGGYPDWDAGAVELTRIDATHWRFTATGKESTQLEYKYTLGSFDYVEKGGACDEIANRLLTLSYGANGQQTVADTVPNWRNVAPCGN